MSETSGACGLVGETITVVADGVSALKRYADRVLRVPETHEWMSPALANVQLVAYHMAKRLHRSIDKPRNLAESVMVGK